MARAPKITQDTIYLGGLEVELGDKQHWLCLSPISFRMVLDAVEVYNWTATRWMGDEVTAAAHTAKMFSELLGMDITAIVDAIDRNTAALKGLSNQTVLDVAGCCFDPAILADPYDPGGPVPPWLPDSGYPADQQGYDDYLCDVAHAVVDTLIIVLEETEDAMRIGLVPIAILQAILTAGATFIGAVPIAIGSALALLVEIAAILDPSILESVRNEIDAARSDLVCAIINGGTATGSVSDFTTVLASAVTPPFDLLVVALPIEAWITVALAGEQDGNPVIPSEQGRVCDCPEDDGGFVYFDPGLALELPTRWTWDKPIGEHYNPIGPDYIDNESFNWCTSSHDSCWPGFAASDINQILTAEHLFVHNGPAKEINFWATSTNDISNPMAVKLIDLDAAQTVYDAQWQKGNPRPVHQPVRIPHDLVDGVAYRLEIIIAGWVLGDVRLADPVP